MLHNMRDIHTEVAECSYHKCIMQITPAFFTWLVGPMEAVEATVDDGQVQRSGVHIQRCRCCLMLMQGLSLYLCTEPS